MKKKICFTTLSVRQLWEKTEEVNFNKAELIGRDLFGKLKKGLDSRKIEVIYGPRQSGKTTLFLFMVDYLNAGGINTGNIWYVNLDVISTHSLFENSETFLYLFDKMQMEDRIYLFLDEIQRLKNPGLFLKGLYDSRRNIKVFVSGSASFELKAKVKEFLTGRKRQHLVLPLSFREIIAAQGIIPPEVLRQEVAADTIEDWEKANDVYGKYLMEELDNVMLYGLYPGVYAQPDRETKLEELYEIYNTYLKKDIFDYFKIERPEVFNNLVKVFAGQAGNMINISELCSLLSGARSTVEKYISILKDTFIVSLLSPFTSNKRSEIKYAAKVYFLDLGIRNFVQKNLSPILSRSDAGSMIENVVFIEMQKNLKLLDDVHYWRTKSKAEVDFILSGEGGIIPVEVKAGSARIGTLTRSFHSFIDTYKPRQAVFINKDKFGYTRVHETDVFYIPVYWFLLISGNLRFCKREKRNTEDTERNENTQKK